MNLTVLWNITKRSKDFIFLGFLIGVGLILRFAYFPYGLPVVVDANNYFLYASDIIALGHLPNSWMPANNGWPIFLSFWFSIIKLDDPLGYMQIQKILSVIISTVLKFASCFLENTLVSSKPLRPYIFIILNIRSSGGVFLNNWFLTDIL